MKKRMNGYLRVGLIMAGFMVALVIVGAFWTPYDPNAMAVGGKFESPSLTHLMGTDNFGRDIFSRVLQGAGTTFAIAVATVAIGAVAGTAIGALTGYFGGVVDEALMRLNDALTAFPSILLALVVVSVLGAGKYKIILTLGILFIPSFARIVRGEFAKERTKDYVQNARIMGAGPFRILFAHILPNVQNVLLSSAAIGFNNAVLAEASMSYLSMGVQPPDASLGRMLSEAQGTLFTTPWCAVFTGGFIVLMILGFTLLGQGFQEREVH